MVIGYLYLLYYYIILFVYVHNSGCKAAVDQGDIMGTLREIRFDKYHIAVCKYTFT